MFKPSRVAGAKMRLGSGAALMIFIISALNGALLVTPTIAASPATQPSQLPLSSTILMAGATSSISSAANTAWSDLSNQFRVISNAIGITHGPGAMVQFSGTLCRSYSNKGTGIDLGTVTYCFNKTKISWADNWASGDNFTVSVPSLSGQTLTLATYKNSTAVDYRFSNGKAHMDMIWVQSGYNYVVTYVGSVPGTQMLSMGFSSNKHLVYGNGTVFAGHLGFNWSADTKAATVGTSNNTLSFSVSSSFRIDPLAIDTTSGCFISPGATCTMSMTTANINDVFIISCFSCTSVTTSISLQPTLRAQVDELWVWYFIWPSSGSISITCSEGPCVGIAISGANVNTPFDGNPTVPCMASSGNSCTLSTTNANDMIVGSCFSDASSGNACLYAGSGFTLENRAGGCGYCTSIEIMTVTSAQTNLAVHWGGGTNSYGIIGDAVQIAPPMVVQPFQATFNNVNGGSQQTITVSPNCAPSPTTFPGNGAVYDISMYENCAYTLLPPPEYSFTSGGSGTTCSTGTCSTQSATYEGATTPTYVGGGGGTFASGTLACSLPFNIPYNSLIVVFDGQWNDAPPTGASDTIGNQFAVGPVYGVAGDGHVSTFYALSAAASSDQISLQFPGVIDGSASCAVFAPPISGYPYALDTYSTGTSTTSSLSVTSYTPTAGDLVVAGGAAYCGRISGAGAGYTAGYFGPWSCGMGTGAEYLIGSSGSTTSPMTTAGGSSYEYEVSLAFKPATMVTQPFQAYFNTALGGSQQTVTIGGTCGAVPSTFAGDSSTHDVQVISGCSYSLALPSGYMFSGPASGTACSTGTCSTTSTTYEANPIIQWGAAQTASSTSATVALNSVAAGDKILVVEKQSTSVANIYRPSDSLGSIFQVLNAGLAQANSQVFMETFYATATGTGADTVSCNWGATQYNACYVFEVNSAYQAVHGAYMTSGGSGTSVSAALNAPFTAGTNDLVVAMAGTASCSSCTFTPGAGYSAASNPYVAMNGEYRLFSSPTSTSAPMSYTSSSTMYWMEDVVDFSLAAPSPVQTPVRPITITTASTILAGSSGSTYYANGLYWVFYIYNGGWAYSWSSNAQSWSAPVTFTMNGNIGAGCAAFAVYGIDVYRTVTNCDATSGDVYVYYDVGTLNPGGTIAWGSGGLSAQVAYAFDSTISIAVSSNAIPWIYFTRTTSNGGGVILGDVIYSPNSAAFVDQTPGNTAYDFAYGVPADKLVSLTSGKMALVGTCSYSTGMSLCATEWNSGTWNTPATSSSPFDIQFGGVTTLGDTIAVAGVSDSAGSVNELAYLSLPYGGAWSTPTVLATVSNSANIAASASIASDGSSTLIMAYGTQAGTVAYAYSTNSGGAWSSFITITNSEPLYLQTIAMTPIVNNEVAMTWGTTNPPQFSCGGANCLMFTNLYGPVTQPIDVPTANGAPSTSYDVSGCGSSTSYTTGSIVDAVEAGGCTYTVSNSASQDYIPVMINNSQLSPTPSTFQQLISFTPSAYSDYLSSNLGNIRFYDSTTFTAANELYAWNQNGASPTQSSAAFWVKLTSSIPADSSTTIYMVFEPLTTTYDGVYWGAPANIASGVDNGANVFSAYAGGTTLSGWTTNNMGISSPAMPNTPSGAPFGSSAIWMENSQSYAYMNVPAQSGSEIIEGFIYPQNAGVANIFSFLASTTPNGNCVVIGNGNVGSYGISDGPTPNDYTCGTAPDASSWDNEWLQVGVVVNGGSATEYVSPTLGVYGSEIGSNPSNTYSISNDGTYFFMGAGNSGINVYMQGVLIRAYPPNGVMPSTSMGSVEATGNSQYVFQGFGTAGTAAITGTSCYSGTCPEYYYVDYYEVQNTWQGTAVAQTTFDPGLTATLTGEQAGTASQTVCAMDTTAASTVNCIGLSDYNTPVTVPASLSGTAADIRWENAANGASTVTATTGGNTENTNFYKQGYGTFEDVPKFGSWDSGLTGGQPTGSYLGSSGQSCTITLSGSGDATCQGWVDWNSVATIGAIAGGPANIRWLQYGSASSTITSGGFTIAATFARQTYNTFSASPVTPGTFSPNIVFSVATSYANAESACAITVPASPSAGPYGASCWSDSGQAFTFPKGAINNPYGTTWLAVSGQTMTASTTTGGNTFSIEYSANTFGTQCPDPSASLAAAPPTSMSLTIPLIQWVVILGAGLTVSVRRKKDERVGVTAFLEAFILIATVIAGSAITYLAVNHYEQSLNKPSISISTAALQQGAEFAVESVQLSDTGTSSFSALTFSTPNLVTTTSTNWYITVVDASTGKPIIYNNEIAYTCSVTSSILTLSFTSQYNMSPGNSLIVTLAISGKSVVVPGNNYNILVNTPTGAQADQVVVASSNLVV